MGNTLAPPEKPHPNYFGAGVVFSEENMLLCGHEPNKQIPALYGIGGKREPADADYRITALREMCEELFGCSVPRQMVIRLVTNVKSRSVENVEGYIILYYNFDDLQRMLSLMKGLTSPYYTRWPRDLTELIIRRRTTNKSEMGSLWLLPLNDQLPAISEDLKSDIRRLLAQKSSP
jgi:hypothetical protein